MTVGLVSWLGEWIGLGEELLAAQEEEPAVAALTALAADNHTGGDTAESITDKVARIGELLRSTESC